MSRNSAVASARIVDEQTAGLNVPLLVQPEWARDMPWLLQGVTWRGEDEPFDLGLFGEQPVGCALDRWRALRKETGFPAAVHSRQIHGRQVAIHESAASGLLIMEGADGHVTRVQGLLLTVSVADCIPVFIADDARRAVALLHAGWRGIAAGMIESGVLTFVKAVPGEAGALHVHFGPAICGRCYEVGPEVHDALGLPVPAGPAPVDIVAAAIHRARTAGVPAAAITYSSACPKCEPERFFSHRAGSSGRQMGIIGIRKS